MSCNNIQNFGELWSWHINSGFGFQSLSGESGHSVEGYALIRLFVLSFFLFLFLFFVSKSLLWYRHTIYSGRDSLLQGIVDLDRLGFHCAYQRGFLSPRV